MDRPGMALRGKPADGRLVPGDRGLIRILDASMAEAVRRGGAWIACRPGCCECCIGPFPIGARDAARLLQGLAELAAAEPDRAARVVRRACESAARIRRAFPQNSVSAVLAAEDAFEDEPCPALDPDTGTCDLYAARPVTCRTFGPAVSRGGGALGICELCYQGATDEEIAACCVELDTGELEAPGEETLVAFALSDSHRTPAPAST